MNVYISMLFMKDLKFQNLAGAYLVKKNKTLISQNETFSEHILGDFNLRGLLHSTQIFFNQVI